LFSSLPSPSPSATPRPARGGAIPAAVLPSAVLVAIPARNEADTIVRCLGSIDRAARDIPAPCVVVVAADSCLDGTAELAEAYTWQHAQVIVIRGQWGTAGAARAAAVRVGLADHLGDVASCWIANTDADCDVPNDWLARQLAFAQEYAATAGIVTLDPASTSPEILRGFRATYAVDGELHTHVHGANLGVRADAYLAVGGWCPSTVLGEDHGLWDRLRASGRAVIHSTASVVTTSSRTLSRVNGGFASNLAGLVAAS
jgi:glycosyltransferase involved in cell wall biosynthesis